MEKNFEYDPEIDSLCIYDNFDSKKIEGCLVVDNLVFDVTKEGKIMGVEIDNASRFLEIQPEELSNIKEAEIKVDSGRETLYVGFKISLKNGNYKFSYIIPKKKIKITC
ncbi:MAG: DUF2283 domain-containing protein [archaeon]